MVSMKDIAQRCGVSVPTVSKALNNQPGIREETRQLVQKTAREMGYLANSAARALKTHRSYNLGILMVNDRRSGLGHEYFSSMLESFKETAELHGYDITFINTNVGTRPTSYLQHCRYRGLDGVAIACVDFTDPLVLELVRGPIPIVTVDHVFEGRTAVLSDNDRGMEQLVRYAYKMGHRRIAFLHGENTAVTRGRLTGFWRACEDLGLEIPEEYIIPCVYHHPDTCEEATRQLLSLPERPTCIIFPDDYSFIGGTNALIEQDLLGTDHISAIGYDGIQLARMMRLTTYSQNAWEIGRITALQLIRQIEHPEISAPAQITVEGEFLEGNSVKDINP